jgi:general secretion pathway protein G
MVQRIRASKDWSDKNTAQKGFTLVELLVVITVLGILAAVVVFSVSGITDKGQTSACKTDSSEVRTAVAAYQAKNNATDQPTMAQLVTGGFLQQASTEYSITYPSGTLTLTGLSNCASTPG